LQDGRIITWEEEGIWYGVTAIDTWSQFCTEDLITGETNCPVQHRHQLQPSGTRLLK
jgi:hypothetical protein